MYVVFVAVVLSIFWLMFLVITLCIHHYGAYNKSLNEATTKVLDAISRKGYHYTIRVSIGMAVCAAELILHVMMIITYIVLLFHALYAVVSSAIDCFPGFKFWI